MRRAVEALAFLGLASAVHAGVWIGFGAGGAAAPGAGAGGGAPLTLAAADKATVALVRRWDAPPAIAPAPADPAPPRPAPALAAPTLPAAEGGPARPAAAQGQPAPLAPPLPPAPPEFRPELPPAPRIAQTAPPPDPVRPRPRPERHPDPRPARQTGATAAAAAVPQAQPAQRAEGAGNLRAAGQQGPGTDRDAPAGNLRALEREWGAAILSRIARRQLYPAGDHGTGTARVRLTVGRDGRLQEVGLSASSGSAALDRAALDAVRRAGRFPPAPAGLDQARYVFAVPMTFRRD